VRKGDARSRSHCVVMGSDTVEQGVHGCGIKSGIGGDYFLGDVVVFVPLEPASGFFW